MRVLAHVHTLNDAGFIDQALDGLRRQTRPPDGIVVVDNGSTDGTVDRTFPEGVAVIRNGMNLGTSGAIIKGLEHALEKGFDWTWLFDADSVPEPDALEKLLAFYESLPPAEQERICFLACEMRNTESEVRHQPLRFTDSDLEFAAIDDDAPATQCDCFIWTGSLLRMKAVAKIGLPSADYVLDMAEVEYGFRARELGFRSYMVHGCINHQDVGRPPGFAKGNWRFGPFSFRLLEFPPIRCYYYIRNMLYFWLYQFRPRRPRRMVRSIVHAVFYPRTFAVRPFSHGRQVIACLRGLGDGLTGRIDRRY